MLKIVKDNKPSLREKSVFVDTPLSEEDDAFIKEMMVYLKNSQDPEYQKKHPECREGVGLAAPQVGNNKRMIVIYYEMPIDEEGNVEIVEHSLVNPKIITNSVRKCYLRGGEGCLSVDDPHPGRIYRDFKIVVKAYEATEKRDVTITARGFHAVVLQHEIDHLDGILFYDHIDKKDPEKVIPDAIEL